MKFNNFINCAVITAFLTAVAFDSYAQKSASISKEVLTQLYQHNIELIFSDKLVPQAIEYTVMPGDTVGKLAFRYKTTIELIERSNHLDDNDIEAGQVLRIWTAPFDIFINKKKNILILKCGPAIMKVYHVSTGTNNITPVGHFTIATRYRNPVWFNKAGPIAADDPNNPLGPCWLGFNIPKYGIHGTIHPTLIGQQVSHGCVRMKNKDVEELYSIVPIGAKVDIIDQ